jgi:hypothetical protein
MAINLLLSVRRPAEALEKYQNNWERKTTHKLAV